MRKLKNKYIVAIRADDVAEVNDFKKCTLVETGDDSLVWEFNSLGNVLSWLKRNPDVVVEIDDDADKKVSKFAEKEGLKYFKKLDYEQEYKLTGKDKGILSNEEKEQLRPGSVKDKSEKQSIGKNRNG